MKDFIYYSSINLISPYVVWTIFGSSLLYLFFNVRNKPKSFVSFLIIFAGITGLFEYIGGFAIRFFHFFLYLYLWFFILFRKGNRPNQTGVVFYVVFSVCYLLMLSSHGFSDVYSDLRQYVIYSFPFIIYIFFDKFKNKINYKQEMEICFWVFNAQIIASLMKLILVGFNEKLVGTISISGGSIAALFPIVYFMILWFQKEGHLKKEDYLWILASLLVAISSNKRAVWFLFPFTIACFFFIYKKLKLSRYVVVMLFIIPFVLYFGIRLNPSLNPERQLWGSFDPEYVYNYVVEYNLGGQNYINTDTASGRLGSNYFYFQKMKKDFFNEDVIFGIGNHFFNNLNAMGGPTSSLLNFSSKNMLTVWAAIFVKFGTIVLFPFTIFFLLLIRTVKNNKVYLSLMVVFLPWFLFYSISVIQVPLFLLPFFLIIMNYGFQHRIMPIKGA